MRKRKVGRPRKAYRKSNMMTVGKRAKILVADMFKVYRCPHCGSLMREKE
jgi:hypothetical protein